MHTHGYCGANHDLAFCSICNIVYCKKCGQEWGRNYYYYPYWTYPNYYPYPNYYGTTTTYGTGNLDYSNVTYIQNTTGAAPNTTYSISNTASTNAGTINVDSCSHKHS
jgi:hypothetical protein